MKRSGKSRFRRNWRGKMILQIEWQWSEPVPGGKTLVKYVSGWRDATWKDVKWVTIGI